MQISRRNFYAVRATAQLRLGSTYWRPVDTWATMLTYHIFTTQQPRCFEEVRLETFARQLEYFRRRYCLAPLTATLDSLFASGSTGLPRPALMLSIDDGERCILEAMPLFERFAAPVVVFVPVGLFLPDDDIDAMRSAVLRSYRDVPDLTTLCELPRDAAEFFNYVMELPFDRGADLMRQIGALRRDPRSFVLHPLLSFAELRELAQHPLVTLASHSMSHQPLGLLPPAWLRWEIERSQEHIAALGGDPHLFAYPYGDAARVSPSSHAAMARAHVRYAFTTRSRPIFSSDNGHIHGRTFLVDTADPDYIDAVLNGALGVWDNMRHIKRQVRQWTSWRPWQRAQPGRSA